MSVSENSREKVCFRENQYEGQYCDPGTQGKVTLKSPRKHWGRKNGGHSFVFSVKVAFTLCGSCGKRNALKIPSVALQ